MKKFLLLLPVFFVLSACSDSDSSSGGGAERYTGNQEVRFIVIGGGPEPVSTSFVLEKDGSKVTIIDDAFRAEGTVREEEKFIISTGDFTEVINGVSCVGSLLYRGNFTGNTVQGTLLGDFDCDNGDEFNVGGDFSATR